jgi:RecA/RadA recombinase
MPPKPKKTYTPPKTLEGFLGAQEKKYGSRVIRRDAVAESVYIPTGSLGLDMATGGGWRVGRIHQIIGQAGCAKTSLAIRGMAEAQKMFPNKAVGYIDVERTFEWEWAETLGLDTDTKKRFTIIEADSSEDVSDILRDMLRSELYSMVVVDSIGGMERAQVIFEKDAEDNDMGKNAQVITRLCKQCAVIGSNTGTTTLLINQYRKNFNGGMDQAAGPMVLGYATTDSVTMRRTFGEGNIETRVFDGNEIEVSRKIVAKVERSKIFPQGRKAEFFFNNVDTDFGPIGIDVVGEVFMMARRAGIIVPTKEGSSWLVLPDGTKENGEPATKRRIRSEPALLEALRAKCVDTVAHERIEETEVTFEPVG